MGCDDLLRPSSTNVCFLVSICLHLDLNSSPGCTRFQTGSVLHGCRAVETPAREVNLPIPLQGNWGPVAGTAGELDEACFAEGTGAINGPIIAPNAGVPDVPGFGYRAVALPSTWDTHAREAVLIDKTIQSYADAGVAAFANTDVETQAGEIDQTVVSDLDGDGDTEALVVFGHENVLEEGEPGPPGGFSALLLIDADSLAATEIEKSFTPIAADPAATPPFDSYRVLDVADLNGDGIAEVLVHTWFADGASVIVYTYDGITLSEVLTAGCDL